MLRRLLGQMVALLVAVNVTAAGLAPHTARAAGAEPVHIVAFGDSLTAGYGVGPGDAFPVQLERALRAAGHRVEVANAGVSGDTTGRALTRLDWAVPDGTDAVIVALGANDMLTGLPVDRARANLEAIVSRLQARGIEVMLAGIRASRNLGDEYGNAFDAIFPALAEKHGLVLYPFFLDGVALDPRLNQPDGIHPTAEGVAVIVKRMLPTVEELIRRVERRRSERAAAGTASGASPLR